MKLKLPRANFFRTSIVLNNVLLSLSIFSLLFCLEVSAQVKGKIKLNLIEAGGNAAAYGYVGLTGPSSRTQSFSCPIRSLGEYPSGIVSTDTTYGSTSSSEWQPGDILTAFSFPNYGTDIPLDARNSPATSCSWYFKGWSGVCEGMGTFNNILKRYECTFTLPSSGDIVLNAAIFAEDYLNRACPALNNPYQPTPVPAPTAVSQGTDETGNRLLDSLNKIADEIVDRLRIKNFLKLIAKKALIPVTRSPYDIEVSVTATGEGTAPVKVFYKKPVKISIASNPVIAKARAKSSTKKKISLELATTKTGLKIPIDRKTLEVTVVVKAKEKKKTIAQVTVVKILRK